MCTNDKSQVKWLGIPHQFPGDPFYTVSTCRTKNSFVLWSSPHNRAKKRQLVHVESVWEPLEREKWFDWNLLCFARSNANIGFHFCDELFFNGWKVLYLDLLDWKQNCSVIWHAKGMFENAILFVLFCPWIHMVLVLKSIFLSFSCFESCGKFSWE